MARLQTKDPIQADRRFIISYFLCDDTLSVHEPTLKNSGLQGGRFLERTKIKKPNQPTYSTRLPEYYTHRDLYVGAMLNVNAFLFKLYDADEYCYKYMEKRSNDLFPYSSLVSALGKLRMINKGDLAAALDDAWRRADSLAIGLVDFPTFFSVLKRAIGELLIQAS